MAFSNVGKVWTIISLRDYLSKLTPPKWCKGVCLHHTASPSLAQRPKGFTAQHIENMRYGYVHERGWSSGPHFYTDEDQVWGMTSPTEKGVHAIAFNSSHIGIEVLGDYDSEDPFNGRGRETWFTTFEAVKVILDWLKLPIDNNSVKFHREDPKTSKTCPGKKITKEWVFKQLGESFNLLPNKIAVPAPTRPVVSYVTANKGYTEAEAIKLLKKQGTKFFFGTDWLEGAFYDAVRGSTVAPLRELESIKQKS